MSPSEMMPPRVAQRIGQVGLPPVYSAGQAKLLQPTAAIPKRAETSIDRSSLVEMILELGVFEHLARLKLGEVHCLEQPSAVEQEKLETVRGDLRGGLVYLGVGKLVEAAIVGVGATPDVVRAEIARRGQRLLEWLLQLSEVDPHLEFVVVAHDFPIPATARPSRPAPSPLVL